MATKSVFISSVVQGFEKVRDQAASGVEAVGLHPIRSERSQAAAGSPKRALFDEIADADIYLLLLGGRYGEPTSSGLSPTEDEYTEAVRLSRPLLVLVQDCEMESAQRAFLERVRGTWGDGVFYGTFQDSNDAALEVAGALAKYNSGIVEDGPGAQAHVVDLVQSRPRDTASGVMAYIGFVPLRRTLLLDSLALDDSALPDHIAALLRETKIVPQQIGISPTISSSGISLEGSASQDWSQPFAVVHSDGSVLVGATVRVADSVGFSLVDPERLLSLVTSAGEFAQRVWKLLDKRDEVGNVAVAACIPDAQYVGFGPASGSTMRLGSGSTASVVAPNPAVIAPRGELSGEKIGAQVVSAVKRVFSDAGAAQ